MNGTPVSNWRRFREWLREATSSGFIEQPPPDSILQEIQADPVAKIESAEVQVQIKRSNKPSDKIVVPIKPELLHEVLAPPKKPKGKKRGHGK